jgi:hypothetical protein
MQHQNLVKLQRYSMWLLTCALAVDASLSVAAFIERRIRDRNWDKAIAEDLDKAAADAKTER